MVIMFEFLLFEFLLLCNTFVFIFVAHKLDTSIVGCCTPAAPQLHPSRTPAVQRLSTISAVCCVRMVESLCFPSLSSAWVLCTVAVSYMAGKGYTPWLARGINHEPFQA